MPSDKVEQSNSSVPDTDRETKKYWPKKAWMTEQENENKLAKKKQMRIEKHIKLRTQRLKLKQIILDRKQTEIILALKKEFRKAQKNQSMCNTLEEEAIESANEKYQRFAELQLRCLRILQ
ncbi:uncharacterized protein LOC131664558 isoform X2 [Phymastichus coffea]|uniref:uncharacterized protein LOC131664558 isoform X2 n=1 Tax=Phymastichus coffea TaxID=108790 RepID=UPI00273A88F5|nr:uncharacterized protein LOC131664558 isoform X2 [Phymastichus coffea]